MATHCSILVWKIPWTEEPGRLHAIHRITKNQTRLSNYTLNSGSLLLLFSRSEVLTLWDLMDCSTRVLCPLFSPGGYWESCPLSQWCYLTISSSITVFSSPFSFPVSGSSPVSQHCIKWPKYWSFSFSLSNEYSEFISFRMDWFHLLAVQGTLKSLL